MPKTTAMHVHGEPRRSAFLHQAPAALPRDTVGDALASLALHDGHLKNPKRLSGRYFSLTVPEAPPPREADCKTGSNVPVIRLRPPRPVTM